MDLDRVVEVRVFLVASTTTIEAVEANIQASGVVLPSPISMCKSSFVDADKTHYGVEALCTVFSVDWLCRGRRMQL